MCLNVSLPVFTWSKAATALLLLFFHKNNRSICGATINEIKQNNLMTKINFTGLEKLNEK